jgi:hypothetical protein
MPNDIKPSRFSIFISALAALGSLLLLLPLSALGIIRGLETGNNIAATGSAIATCFWIYVSARHVLILKKRGVKGWIDVNTRLRKV